ncbi:transmembrane protein adipocyte-associated 1 homolog isoform X2 [Brevipalpus obovatus]|uniref:transmembrane protein adipocyte-associated 1 homolog isoform X2 n=1 Tax=Brevipalpus obovatus TaxID=246614 RepID=UPI003D9E05C2
MNDSYSTSPIYGISGASSMATNHSLLLETPSSFFSENIPHEDYHICEWILYQDIPKTGLHIWDVLIAAPNLFFFLFLVFKFKSTRQRLKATTSPVLFTFYALVCLNVSISLLRCFLSMIITATSEPGKEVGIIFWILVRFFLLATEISVVVFCLAFGHLDSRTSIKRVLLVTSCISLVYSTIQGSLEFINPDQEFYFASQKTRLFGHGGMIFWSCTSAFFGLIYFYLSFLPWMPCRHRIPLPDKPTFYRYCFALFLLNLIQAIGSALYHNHQIIGMCIVDVTVYLYFTTFTPLVYWSFLASFFSYTKSLMFSYKPQLDDGLDDNIITPGATSNPISHQLSCSSVRTDGSDLIYQPKLIDSNARDMRDIPIGDVRLSFYESSLSPDSIRSGSVNS